MVRIILGIDPGASGCIAAINGGDSSDFTQLDYPCYCRMTETEVDVSIWLRTLIETEGAELFAFIERVHSMPKQGVSSSFKFGQSYGFLRGLIVGHGIPFEEVTPQRWQKEIGCLTKGDKNVSKAKAQQLFPAEKIVHANADALLIAEYGRRTVNQRNGAPHVPAG